MLEAEQGRHLHLVEHAKVVALLLVPPSTAVAGSERSWVVVDGEAVPLRPTFTEVHPGLCRTVVALK
jgi:hypothetical protein